MSKKKNKLGTQYQWILGAPTITDNTNYEWILGAPSILVEAAPQAMWYYQQMEKMMRRTK